MDKTVMDPKEEKMLIVFKELNIDEFTSTAAFPHLPSEKLNRVHFIPLLNMVRMIKFYGCSQFICVFFAMCVAVLNCRVGMPL